MNLAEPEIFAGMSMRIATNDQGNLVCSLETDQGNGVSDTWMHHPEYLLKIAADRGARVAQESKIGSQANFQPYLTC